MIYLNPMDRLKKQEVEQEVEQDVSTKLTVKDLKQLCKDRGLSNYSKLKEAELIALLEKPVEDTEEY